MLLPAMRLNTYTRLQWKALLNRSSGYAGLGTKSWTTAQLMINEGVQK
jgi:hypothetical protein